MKTKIFLIALLCSIIGFAQNSPITFEPGEFGNTWTWTVFENEDNPPLEVVANPDPSGINTSATVAKFTARDAGQPYAGVESMHGSDIGTFDLTSDNATVKIMVWKTKISDVGIKFATPPGGAQQEIKVANTLINQWEEITIDFSGYIGLPETTGLDQIIIFPDFIDRTADDIIYFDNITFGEPVAQDVALPVDFELGAAAYDFAGFEGADSAVEANPDMSGENTSGTVMRTIKTNGSQFFAGTFLNLDTPIDFSTSNVLTMKTWSPKTDIPVRLAIENQTTGNQIFVDVNTTTMNAWETLSFDFTGLIDSNIDYNKVVVFFEFIVDLPGDGSTYYFDDIEVFEEPVSMIGLPVDFELGAGAYDFAGFEGADSAIEANPDMSGENTTGTVMRTTKTNGAQFFAGTFLNLDTPIDFSESNVLNMKTWSPKTDIPVRLALENQTTGNQIFVDVNTTTMNAWETLSYDFTGLIDGNVDYNKIVVFFEFIVDLPGDGSTYYFDELEVAAAASGLNAPITFEPGEFGNTWTWEVFENADNPPLEIITNPDPSGNNTSATVAQFTARDAGQPFAGVQSQHGDLGSFDLSSENSTIKIMVWKTKISDVGIKFATPSGGAQPEIKVANTLINQWEEITFDFSGYIGLPETTGLDQIIIFPDFIDRTADDIIYFDNITFGPTEAQNVELPIDFELGAAAYDFAGFEGADSAIEANPDMTGENTSATIMRTTKTDGAQFFAGTFLNIDTPIDFSTSNVLTMKTWSPKADIPVRMAIENQTTGNQIFVDVNTTTINAWETLTYDFTGLIDGNIDYNRVVVFFEFIVDLPGDGSTYYFDDIEVFEEPVSMIGLPVDFELGAAAYDFAGFEGADSAIEANPDMTGENTSATIMRTTKTDGAQFFAGTFLNIDTPIDFSTSNVLTMKTWSPKADIPVRMAIENQTTGNQIFVDVNTTTINAWETLTYDFTGLIDGNIDYNRVVVFFEFIVDLPGDGSTYYFDDIEVFEEPVSMIGLPVDFELGAAAYDFAGFEGADSAIEANPDMTGENTSATIMRTTKTDGAQFFAGTFLNLDTPIDFSTSNVLTMKTWSPKADIPVRMAIENQTTGNQIFVDVNTTTINAWETLSYDFTGLIDGNIDYNRVVVFFEFIVDLPGDGSTYYYDDIEVFEEPAPIIELPIDFELGAAAYDFLGFEGADSAIEANPDMTGENTSGTVMRTIKTDGAQFFAGTFLNIDTPIDFSTSNVISMKTWSPKADIPVRMALENQTTGNQIFVDVNTTTINAWETLSYDFTGLIDTNIDYNRIVVFFEFIVDLPGDGSTYYYDDIEVVEEPAPIIELPIDFELGAAAYDFAGFEGADSAIEANPDMTGENTSATIMRTTKTDGAQFFAGTFINIDTPIDFSTSNVLSMKTWSPKADIPVRMAIENQTTGNQIFVDVNTTTINAWETLTYDFTGLIDTNIDYNKVVVFFEFVVDLPGDGSTYYFDDIEVFEEPGPIIELPVDFELGAAAYDFLGFEGADSAIEMNPDMSGENTSDTVMRTIKTDGAQFFAGTFLNIDTPIDFSESNVLSMKTWSPKADIPVRMAIENQTTGNQIFVDVNTTTINAWETLSFDFTGLIDGNIDYNRVVVFFEFIVDLPGDGSTYYFDDIEVDDPLSIEDNELQSVISYPNPTQNVWNIRTNSHVIESIQLLDLQGRIIFNIVPNASEAMIDASSLPTGIYLSRINTSEGTKIIKLIKQ